MVLVSSQGGKRGWLEWGLEGGSSANDTILFTPLLCNGAHLSFVSLKCSR